MRVDGAHGEVQQVFVNGIACRRTSRASWTGCSRAGRGAVGVDRRRPVTVWAQLEELWDETIERGSRCAT
jgi:hypothetical protein